LCKKMCSVAKTLTNHLSLTKRQDGTMEEITQDLEILHRCKHVDR
jgi:hypothetical protein